jgi:hypothetical protein
MDGSVGLVVDGWVVLGVVVSPIVAAFFPVVAELFECLRWWVIRASKEGNA